MFIKHWEDNYNNSTLETLDTEEPLCTHVPLSLNSVFRLNRDTPGVREAIARPANEAEDYLRSPIVRDGAETPVLAIWKRLEASYPSVANMARDILAVPGKS